MKKKIFGRSAIDMLPTSMGYWTIGGAWNNFRIPASQGGIKDAELSHNGHNTACQESPFFDGAPQYGCGHSEQVSGQAVKNRHGSAVMATGFEDHGNTANKEVFIYGGMCGGFPLITRWS